MPIESDLCLRKFYKANFTPGREVGGNLLVHFTEDYTEAMTNLGSVVDAYRDRVPGPSLMIDPVADWFLIFSFFIWALFSFRSWWVFIHTAHDVETNLFFSLNDLFPENDLLLPSIEIIGGL